MNPVQTEKSNLLYAPPSGFEDTVGALPCERIENGYVRTVWKPTEEERARIFGGDNIFVDVLNEPIPPLAVGITDELVK
jgi:hypothetical protein